MIKWGDILKDILVLTVGTSLYNNLKKTNNLMEWDVNKGVEYLREIDLETKVAGAEINTVLSLIKDNILVPKKAYLISSNTVDGILASEIIKNIMIEKLKFNEVDIVKVENLNPSNLHDFSKKGLKNLVSEISKIITKHSNVSELCFAPIGGFKTQIFMVGLMAQIYGISSYYMYENFKSVTEILPLPISFDNQLYIDNVNFFNILDCNNIVDEQEVLSYIKKEPQLKNLIEYEKMDNIKYVSLSPMGNLYFYTVTDKVKSNLPEICNKKNGIISASKEAHANEIINNTEIQTFLNQILSNLYVEKIVTNYYNPDNKGDIVKIRSKDTELKFEINHKKGILGGIIYTTAKNKDQLEAVKVEIELELLNNKYVLQ